MRLSKDHYIQVQSDIVAAVVKQGLDGIILTSPADIAYVAGFFYAVSERPVYLWMGSDYRSLLIVPELDAEYADAQDVMADVAHYFEFPGVRSPARHLADELRRRSVEPEAIGYGTGVPVEGLAWLQESFPAAEFRPFTAVDVLRQRKRSAEISLHRKAAGICDSMLAAGRRFIEAVLADGSDLPTEGAVAQHVISFGTARMYNEFENVIFTTKLAGGLVYGGPNSARPHGLPSSRRLQVGDTFILSLGAAVGSRFVESERTFFLGEPTSEQREYYEVTRTAQQVGLEAMAVGAVAAEVNERALNVIRDAGFGKFIRHRLGHGIGVQNHEPPWVEAGDRTVLRAGMILSSEPGIYVPGHGGYRISDTVLVTDGGPERLTQYPTDLEENVIR